MSSTDAVDVEIEWNRPAREVSVYTSHDEFAEPIALTPDAKETIAEGEAVEYQHFDAFRGMLKLPHGQYLMRFKVDGEWHCREDMLSTMLNGEEYNRLVVGPEADEPKEPKSPSSASNSSNSTPALGAAMPAKKPSQRKRQAGKWAHAGSIQDEINNLKEEVVRREQEWREAWISHELKTQQIREQEKAELQASFRAERSKWTARIKKVEKELKEAREHNVTLEGRSEKAESSTTVSQSAWHRERDQLQEQIKNLALEVSSMKLSRDEAEAAQRTTKQDLTQLQSTLEAARNELKRSKETAAEQAKEAADLLAEVTSERDALVKKIRDTPPVVVAAPPKPYEEIHAECLVTAQQLKEQIAALEKTLADKEAEHQAERQREASNRANLEEQLRLRNDSEQDTEKKLESGLQALAAAHAELARFKDSSAEAAAQVAQTHASEMAKLKESARAETETVRKQLEEARTAFGEKEQALTQSLAERETTVTSLREEVAGLEERVTKARASNEQLQSSIAALKEELTASESAHSATTARLQAAEAQLAEIDGKRAQQLAALETEKAALTEKFASVQSSLDERLKELDSERAERKLLEATWQREKSNLLAEVESAGESREALKAKTEEMVATLATLSQDHSALKREHLEQSSAMTHAMQEARTQMVKVVMEHNTLLDVTIKKYKKEASERRKYFNMVQELKGNIRVFCRARPMLPHDHKRNTTSVCSTNDSEDQRVIKVNRQGKDVEFEFDRVFGANSTQEEVFRDTRPLIQSVMDGYNVCIFAYGQTGSGKTHTMNGDASNRGVNFRALSELFKIKQERSDEYEYTISVSMLEIYNENVRDLLDPKEKECKIRTGVKGMFVEGLSEEAVESEADVLAAMGRGEKNRSTDATQMNEHSSRSHSLVSVKVEGINRTAGVSYFGKLHLIDLAGSERLAKTHATGDRLKEAQAINKSLSALGNVIEALQKKSQHVPYRNSKLTFLLQDSLGGHAKTLMFINVSPTAFDVEETIQSLQFATRVRSVELGTASRSVSTVMPSGDDDLELGDDRAPSPGDELKEVASPVRRTVASPRTPMTTASVKKLTPSASRASATSTPSVKKMTTTTSVKKIPTTSSVKKVAPAKRTTTPAKP